MCIAVGKVSLELWDLFTWLLGCTFASGSPLIWFALLAITSLRFMLLWVPLPVCHTASPKLPSSLPSRISLHASDMDFALASSRTPSLLLAIAEAFFSMAKARTISSGIFSMPILKLSMLLWLWAPYSLSTGTRTSPMVSFSTLYPSFLRLPLLESLGNINISRCLIPLFVYP